MNQLFKKAAAFSLSIILFGTSAKAYNLSPISFANFYHIAEEGDLQGLKDVQRRGLNLNSTNQNGDTAVCVAIKRQDYLAYKTLIRAGAKSNPDCTKKIPEYAHKAFLSNYNQKYAAPQTPINWTKSGTALLVGAGVAAGTVALIGVGGGGGGSGGSSNDSGNTQDCSVNKCALGCFENKVCSENEVCDSYNTCGGCESCKVSSSCKQNSCNQGCYTNLTCQPGYTCSKRNKCGGCESCAELSECKKNVCAAGCYTNLTCADGYTCSQKNICGGCDRCTLIDPTNPDISNALHCKNYDRNKNLCLACHQYYKIENGRCVDDIPENCEDYNSASNKCTSCIDGYKVSDDGRVCLEEIKDLECNATNYPLTTIPDKSTSYYDTCTGTDTNKTKRYRISGCKEGYQINTAGTACQIIPDTCTATAYPLSACPDKGICESCTTKGTAITRYKMNKCEEFYEKDTSSTGSPSCKYVGDTQTCPSTVYPLKSSCPKNSECDTCIDKENIEHNRIKNCMTNYELNEAGNSCEAISEGSCTNVNYPLVACPEKGACGSCTDGETTRYKLNTCELGYLKKTDTNECVTPCNTTEFPIQNSCPADAVCDKCTDNKEHFGIKECLNGKNISLDKLSCVNDCNTEEYPSNKCPDNAICGVCSDKNGNHYKVTSCFSGYEQSGNACVVATIEAKDNDIVNDASIELNTSNLSESDKEALEVIKINNKDTYLTLSNYTKDLDKLDSNVYNAKTKDADITFQVGEINNVGVNAIGIASLSEQADVINAFTSKKGTITILASGEKDHDYLYGMLATKNGYNSYNATNAYINLDCLLGSNRCTNVIGIGNWYQRTPDGLNKTASNSFLYNAFGGTGKIRLLSENSVNLFGMYGNNIINAINKGTGTIELVGNARTVAGLYSDNESDLGVVVNAYGSGSTGKIDISFTNPIYYSGYSIYGIVNSNRKRTAANAYGSGATGEINISHNSKNSSINEIAGIENGDNAIYGATGKITISALARAVFGIKSGSNAASANSTGEINITIPETENFSTNIYGIAYNGYNAYGSGSKGTISITTTGGYNTIYGLWGDVDNGAEGGIGTINITSEKLVEGSIIGIEGCNNSNGFGSSVNIKVNDQTTGNKGKSSLQSIKGMMSNMPNGVSDPNMKNDGTISISAAHNNFKIIGMDSILANLINNGKITIEGKRDIFNLETAGMQISGATLKAKNEQNSSIDITIDGITSIKIPVGTVESVKDHSAKAYGMNALNSSSISNRGSITITHNNPNTINLYGMSTSGKGGQATNYESGTITINVTKSSDVDGNIYGMYAEKGASATNLGTIKLTTKSNNNNVYGMYADNATITNKGTIELSVTSTEKAFAMYAVNNSKLELSIDSTIKINDTQITSSANSVTKKDGKEYITLPTKKSAKSSSLQTFYIDKTSQIVNNGTIVSDIDFNANSDGGGKLVLAKGGKIIAPEIKGEITADANITSGGFDKTYSSENAVSGKNDEVKLNSGSALFDAVLKNNDIVMTMKDFDKVVDDKSLAAYLQHNYNAKRNDGLFNQLKTYDTAQNLNSALNQNLGFSLLPNFAQENMNVFRSLSNLVTDTMFSQDLTNERMMVGYDYLGQDRSSKGRVTGYENTANSSYFLADTKLNNSQRLGLGVALTRFNSDYDDDSTRKATFAQALASYMHNFGNHWQYAGVARLGYADGDYKRKAGSTRIEGDTSDILYGLNNELRYNYDFGFMTLEPQVELNAYGYYQRKIKEDDAKTDALLVDGTNNLSVEAGAGLYASKETVYGENGRIKARLGGSYYRELSQPYHSMHARVRDTDGYYLIESTDIFDRNRMVVRADITFSWKALDFYLRGSQFMEDKHTTVINAGVKYNF